MRRIPRREVAQIPVGQDAFDVSRPPRDLRNAGLSSDHRVDEAVGVDDVRFRPRCVSVPPDGMRRNDANKWPLRRSGNRARIDDRLIQQNPRVLGGVTPAPRSEHAERRGVVGALVHGSTRCVRPERLGTCRGLGRGEPATRELQDEQRGREACQGRAMRARCRRHPQRRPAGEVGGQEEPSGHEVTARDDNPRDVERAPQHQREPHIRHRGMKRAPAAGNCRHRNEDERGIAA